MSDTRRRRKSQQSGGSEDLSDSYEEINATKETQSSEHTEDHHDSEYDTAGSESDVDSQDKTQRESGDGQEEDKPQKKLDDDEDRRNPQYIPKRGTFYEHDDRTADEVNAEVAEKEPEREVKDKKVWKDKGDRWDHDRYNDAEQAPKSHGELIAVYGYDIRNEEGPPRARRRRRYGRGPNKYTRNWEDEDAYGKVSGNLPVHKVNKKPNRTGEDFPSLDPKDRDGSQNPVDEPVITSAWYSNKNKNKPQNFPPLQQAETQKLKPKEFTNSPMNDNKTSSERNIATWKKESKNTPFNPNANDVTAVGRESEKIVIVKTALRENKRPPLVQESVSLAASKSRGRGFKANTNNNIVGSRTIESKPKGRGPGPMTFDNRKASVEHDQIVSDMKHMNVSTEGSSYHHTARQNKHFYTQSPSQQHPAAVPSRIHPSHPAQQQAPPQQQQPSQQPPQQQQQQPPPSPQDMASNRPKRYSSLRQRPAIAEGPQNPAQPNYQPPPPPPQHTYYPPPQGYAPGPYEQSPPVPAPATSMGGQPVIPGIPPGAPPTTYAPHAPPPFLVPPPQFIPPQTAPPSITINYVPGPNGPIFQPNYQGYNPPGPPPPQDVSLYQPQGCTYYSPAQQPQQQPPPTQLRRPKAIPILPPPDGLRQNRNIQPGPEHQQHQLQQEQLVQHQLQQQQEQLAQQQLQQQQQEQFVQQQLQQHQQQLIQEQQQELQQQELLKQQKQLQQQQEQLQRKQLQQQQQQQELLQQQQLEQKQLEQEQQEQQRMQQLESKQEEVLNTHEEPKNQEDQLVQEEEQKQEIQQEEDKQQEQEEQKEQQVQEEQLPKIDDIQEKVNQQIDLQNEHEITSNETESTEPEKITTLTVSKDEQTCSDSSNEMTTETKVDVEEKMSSDNEKVNLTSDTNEEIPEPVTVVAEEESISMQTKDVIPDVVSSVPAVEEKLETVEVKTEVQIANSLVEKSLIVDSEEAKDISIKTAELVNSKSETDCNIKESAVIEETAA